ncbi:Hypothetical predicted protein [Octopus vulgaris]|uniref:Uncharacterized protein n=1 Tax=Octopus vulgaris TaxID=6645 RepID=A0AA36AWB3_OCTVU|nr:Hypothetical predicted protein [Octopus vulgaris]
MVGINKIAYPASLHTHLYMLACMCVHMQAHTHTHSSLPSLSLHSQQQFLYSDNIISVCYLFITVLMNSIDVARYNFISHYYVCNGLEGFLKYYSNEGFLQHYNNGNIYPVSCSVLPYC